MRALLIVNPRATATTERTRDVLARALGSELKLDVTQTRHRGHAIDLAAQAVTDEVDLVVALGGDGTVNEVANGLAGTGVALAVVPGGNANVFARALGLSPSPVEATSEILDALHAGRRRRIALGRADERYFTFCAGVGIDAEVIRVVERQRHEGRPATSSRYVRSTLRHFYRGTDRRHPAVSLTLPGQPPVGGLFHAIVANGSPWTYLGEHPVTPCPAADFSDGLDVLGLRSLGTVTTLRLIRQMLDPHRSAISLGAAWQAHDVGEIVLTAAHPLAMQLDGDYLGEVERLTFRSVPDALTVVC